MLKMVAWRPFPTIFEFLDFGLLDFTSFYEPQGALRGQKILKNDTLFRAGGFYKLLRATGRPPGATYFGK